MIYRKFKIDKKYYKGLSKDDLRILSILEEVVADIAKVYEVQKKDGFYPKRITKEKIELAAKKHPLILSPFTYIEERNGQLEAIPYHQKYAHLLQPVAEKIQEAAKLSTNLSFKKYLLARAKSLMDGSYKNADRIWLEVKNSKIDFSVGPFERYLDNILFLKRVYQAHVGIIDKELTEAAEEIKETLYSSAKISFDKSHSTNIPKKGVQVVVEQTPATSGYVAEAVFSGEHFPSDLDVMQQCGSKIIIYVSQLKHKFDRLHYPIYKSIFEKNFAANYSKELLLKATSWNILLYELGRQLHKFIGARERLQELYGPIDEANGAVSGVEHAKHLLVKGLISQEELEAIIIIHVVWMFSDWLVYQQNKTVESYVIGNAVILNNYLAKGALKEKNGISWPNFSKMFFELEVLAGQLVHLLKEGNYKEASKFVKENTGFKNFKRLSKNLNKITPSI